MESETWKTHPIFDMYEGSTEGRVRFKRLGRIVKPRTTQTGYHHISVRGKASDRQQGVCVCVSVASFLAVSMRIFTPLQICRLTTSTTIAPTTV